MLIAVLLPFFWRAAETLKMREEVIVPVNRSEQFAFPVFNHSFFHGL